MAKDTKAAGAVEGGAGDGNAETSPSAAGTGTDLEPPAGAAATVDKSTESPPPPVNAVSGTAGADPQATAPAAPAPGADAPAAAPAASIETAAAESEHEPVAAKRETLLQTLEAEIKSHTEAGNHQAAGAISALHARFVDVLHHVTAVLQQEEIKLGEKARELFEDMKKHL